MSFPTDLTTYTVEGALSLCIAVLAYKIYKLRIATDSECCEGCVRIKTVSRGDSSTDLELPERGRATV
jgi:hypothetical protein